MPQVFSVLQTENLGTRGGQAPWIWTKGENALGFAAGEGRSAEELRTPAILVR